MGHKSKMVWITRTAIFIALLVVVQVATAPLGTTIITGSAVNLLLIVSVMTSGLASGLSVAAISPVAAKLAGIGPLWAVIPFILAGNAALVLVWHFIAGRGAIKHRAAACAVSLAAAAAAKFAVLYIGIVQIAVPVFLGLTEQQAAVVSTMFSFPQLLTASVGGALAAVLLPTLKKAISHNGE